MLTADAQADLSLRWAHTHFVGFLSCRGIYGFFCLRSEESLTLNPKNKRPIKI